MSFLDSGLAMDLVPANPTKQTFQEYGNHWISECAYNMHVMPTVIQRLNPGQLLYNLR